MKERREGVGGGHRLEMPKCRLLNLNEKAKINR